MNTLLVTTGFVGIYGGVQTVERSLHRTLAALASCRGSRHVTCSLRDDGEANGNGALPGELFGARGSRRRLVSLVARASLAFRPDVTVFSHVNLARMSPFLALVRSGRRAIIGHGIEVWKRLDVITGLGARFVSEFWCVSNYTAMQLRRYNELPRTPAYLLPNALEDDPPMEEFPEGQPPTLLSVCRLEAGERYKGVDQALRAHALLLSDMPELRFRVVGDGTDTGRLRRVVSDLGTGHRVTFLGRLPAAALAKEYERCSVFVLPSRKEGFGMVFLEAMARGKPVVAFRCGGTPEVVVDGECGFLVEPDDLLGLYHALGSLLHDGALRARMGRSGRQRVQALFTPHAFLRRVGELLTGGAEPLAPRVGA